VSRVLWKNVIILKYYCQNFIILKIILQLLKHDTDSNEKFVSAISTLPVSSFSSWLPSSMDFSSAIVIHDFIHEREERAPHVLLGYMPGKTFRCDNLPSYEINLSHILFSCYSRVSRKYEIVLRARDLNGKKENIHVSCSKELPEELDAAENNSRNILLEKHMLHPKLTHFWISYFISLCIFPNFHFLSHLVAFNTEFLATSKPEEWIYRQIEILFSTYLYTAQEVD